MAIEPGQQLLHYRLIDKIGEGGMGVVWKAVDTNLERQVAIKFLPELFSDDSERLARFEREAKLLATLNHPNIASVFGLHQAEGVAFLAMELVPGEDLQERLSRGALSQEDALHVGLQITQALETAHEHGIVHRDLKPGNVKLAPDGTVKVLDFGLAKAASPEASGAVSPTMSPTLTSAGTAAGMILGTAAYMSPEQAKGKPIDRRADIWSFGVLLYEMLTGRRLFDGETVSETLAAVIMKDLRWEGLPEGTPPRIRRLLRRCLQRDARSRLRDIGDARLAIEEVLAGADRDEDALAAGASISPRSSRGWLLTGAALVAGLLVGLAVSSFREPPAPPSPLRKFELPARDVESARISPDGSRVTYVSARGLYVRDLDRLEVREVPGVEAPFKPFWSPDSQWIGFGAEGKLWRVPADGGQPSVICDLPGSVWGSAAGGAWQPDGTIVFTTGDSGLYRVTAQGGDPYSALDQNPETEDDFHDVSPLPDGRGALYIVHRKGDNAGIDTIGAFVDGEARYLLKVEGQSISEPAYSPTGHVLFRRSPGNPGVWALPVSTTTFEPTGEPFLVAPQADLPSVARDGTLVFLVTGKEREVLLSVVDRNGKELSTIGEPGYIWPFPALSPDERRVVVVIREDAKWDLWVHDVARGTRTRLTFDGGGNEAEWSPDGKRLVTFRGENSAEFKLRLLSADGTGEAEDLVAGWHPSFTPDGRFIVYNTLSDGGVPDLHIVDLEGDREGSPLIASRNAPQMWGRISPDGRYIAYQSYESGRWQVFIKRFPGGEGKWQVSVDGGQWPVWNASGGRLFFAKDEDIMEVEVSTEGALQMSTPRRVVTRVDSGIATPFGFLDGFDVSADGERFYIARPLTDEPVVQNLAVVLNWTAEFE